MAPFSSSPIAKIIKHRMVITALLENPLTASSGETKPVNSNAAIMQKAILSIGKTSKANKIITTAMMIKTPMISIDIPLAN